jgi:hypothetical protein
LLALQIIGREIMIDNFLAITWTRLREQPQKAIIKKLYTVGKLEENQ